MAKNLQIALLLDVYGEMLTEKQRDAVELYYNEDLSLAEISEHMGITRQGVRDSIKRAENQLLDFEEKMGLAHRFEAIHKGLKEIASCAQELQSDAGQANRLVAKKAQRILQVVSELGV